MTQEMYYLAANLTGESKDNTYYLTNRYDWLYTASKPIPSDAMAFDSIEDAKEFIAINENLDRSVIEKIWIVEIHVTIAYQYEV